MDDSYDSSVPLDSHPHSLAPIADETYDGTHEGDLSLSELSVNIQPGPLRSRPFSLLARPSQPPEEPMPEEPRPEDDAEDIGNETAEPVEDDDEDKDVKTHSVVRTREERLRQDLFTLRKLNAGLAVYNDALSDTKSSTERVAEQLKQTNALLDKYVGILAKSEDVTRLIFDERWHGADDDEATLRQLEHEAIEKARKAAEERELAERQERERLEREERERNEKAERDRLGAEKREKLAIRAGYGGVRGVRGTRASTRARGAAVSRIAAAASRGRPSSLPTSTGSGGRVPRPTSSISSKSSTTARPGVK